VEVAAPQHPAEFKHDKGHGIGGGDGGKVKGKTRTMAPGDGWRGRATSAKDGVAQQRNLAHHYTSSVGGGNGDTHQCVVARVGKVGVHSISMAHHFLPL
jgi:hypothetical protein